MELMSPFWGEETRRGAWYRPSLVSGVHSNAGFVVQVAQKNKVRSKNVPRCHGRVDFACFFGDGAHKFMCPVVMGAWISRALF